MGNRLPVSIFT